MTADAEHSLIRLENVHLTVGLVYSVAGATGHRIAAAWGSNLLTLWMTNTVLMGMAAATQLHRIVGKEQGPIAPMGLVTRRALQARVGHVSPIRARLGAARVMALGTKSPDLSPQQARTATGVGIVTTDAAPATCRDMGEGRFE